MDRHRYFSILQHRKSSFGVKIFVFVIFSAPFYRKQVALSLGQIASMLPYPDDMTNTAMQDLMENELLAHNDADDVYYLTSKGKAFVRYYESARDLV